MRTKRVKLTDKEVERIASHIREEKKIYAIKCLREYTGMGLRECKNYIDNCIPKIDHEMKRSYMFYLGATTFLERMEICRCEIEFEIESPTLDSEMLKLIQEHGIQDVLQSIVKYV